jgi:hypothetical protein
MATLPKNAIETASVSWVDNSGTIHIRVYSTDAYTVTERCWDGNGWFDGAFKAEGEAVSATAWQHAGGINLRVYCTNEGKTAEWCNDAGGSGWYQGAYTIG